MTVDCLLHVHSAFSYDSPTDLVDIARTARRHRFGCVLMSEHNNTLNDRRMAEFVARCDELSDSTLMIVPGLELSFDSNRVHLLAYGVRKFIESTARAHTFGSLVERIRDQSAVAVLAHPSHQQALARISPADVAKLDGIEIWNVKNGNRFCPSGSDLRALSRFRAEGSRLFGFAGLDWHHLVNFVRLAVRVEIDELAARPVLEALRAGRFMVHGRFVTVDARGEARSSRVAAYELASATVSRSRRIAYRWQAALERRGVKTPRIVATIGRRFLR